MRAGGLPGELQALRERGRGLSEDVRSVEEEVEVMRGEKERQARSKVADLQTEAIRLKRELEVRSPHTSPLSHHHHHTLPTPHLSPTVTITLSPHSPHADPQQAQRCPELQAAVPEGDADPEEAATGPEAARTGPSKVRDYTSSPPNEHSPSSVT